MQLKKRVHGAKTVRTHTGKGALTPRKDALVPEKDVCMPGKDAHTSGKCTWHLAKVVR